MTVFASRGISIRGALMLCFVLIAAVGILVTSGHRYYWLTTELERDE